VIVDEDYRGRALGDRLTEYLPGMHEGGIQKSSRHGDVALEPVLGVEHGDVEFFYREILQLLSENVKDISRPTDRGAFLSFLGCHSAAELECRMYADCTSRSHAGHSGKSGDGLRGEKPERAAAGRQDLLPDAERRPALGAGAEEDCNQLARA
jgi:hypothetical protein